MDGAGVETIVLKGPVLDELVYPHRGLRPFDDLDLLVRTEDAARAESLLREQGYETPAGTLPESFYRRYHFEIPLVRKEGPPVCVELHRGLLPRWRPHSPGILTVWQRKEPFPPVPRLGMLAPEDAIIYLCCHADLHSCANRYRDQDTPAAKLMLREPGENRLIWFADISRSARFFGERVQWRAVAERSREWGVAAAVYAGLSVAEDLFPGSGLSEALRHFPPPRPSPLKARLIRSAAKPSRPPEKKAGWAARMGLRRPISRADLIEYILPDADALRGMYADRHLAVCRLRHSAEAARLLFQLSRALRPRRRRQG